MFLTALKTIIIFVIIIIIVNKIRVDEMGVGRGTYKGENKCILACGWKSWRNETAV